jgi:predicted ribosome quality control (RQC) complex YloA/Tae2 family protein
MTVAASLQGARIRRIDAPSDDLYALTLAAPSLKGVLLISLAPQNPGLGLVTDRPRGRAADANVMRLRRQLEGARISALRVDHERIELELSRADGTRRLVMDFGAQPRPTLRVSESAEAHGAARPDTDGAARLASLEDLERRGRELLAARALDTLTAMRSALRRGLAAAHKRSERKLREIQLDAERAAQAPELRARATLVLANLHSIARGATSASLLDYTRDPPSRLEIALDPALSAREQAERWFQRARRFERGRAIAAARAAQVEAELHTLRALRDELEGATDTTEAAVLEQIAARASKLGARPRTAAPAAAKRRDKPAIRVPFKTFTGHAERRILVGRGAADNDALTLHHARPHDLWLHARDTAGAHVIVPLERQEACPAELLIDAALLAAHFSSERGRAGVDISYTPRRYVAKPKGSPSGSVTVQREKVLRLQVDPERLARLLATEAR